MNAAIPIVLQKFMGLPERPEAAAKKLQSDIRERIVDRLRDAGEQVSEEERNEIAARIRSREELSRQELADIAFQLDWTMDDLVPCGLSEKDCSEVEVALKEAGYSLMAQDGPASLLDRVNVCEVLLTTYALDMLDHYAAVG